MTVSYVLGPSKPLPEDIKAVAVIDAGVQTQGAHEGDREQKWSAIAADMIEAMLQNGGSEYGGGLAVAKRSQTRQILQEQDLRLSGLVEGADAARAGKLLAVQGLITSKLIISLDVQKSSKSTLDWGAILGGAIQGLGSSRDRDRAPREVFVRPAPRVIRRSPPADPRARYSRVQPGRRLLYAPTYRPTRSPRPDFGGPGEGGFGGFGLKTREVEEISRSLTVQCSFSLVDANTGQAILQYSPPPYQKTDSSSPDFLFGGMVDDADLDPVDHFIGELVERATREFVGMMVPVPFEQTYNLTLSGKRGEAAVRAIRADDYDTASRQLEAALRDDDDGSISFALGVVSELKGDYAGALKWYRQACAAPDPDKDDLPTYLAAKQRLTSHLPRIMVPSAAPPDAAGGQAPAGAPPQIAAPPPAPHPSAEGGAQAPPAAPPENEPAQSQPAPDASSGVQNEIRMIKELEAREKNK